MKQVAKNRFPPGWDESRVRDMLGHYENQSEDEAVREDQAALANSTVMAIPASLVPKVRRMIAEHEAKRAS